MRQARTKFVTRKEFPFWFLRNFAMSIEENPQIAMAHDYLLLFLPFFPLLSNLMFLSSAKTVTLVVLNTLT
jgi:hypothetical protein